MVFGRLLSSLVGDLEAGKEAVDPFSVHSSLKETKPGTVVLERTAEDKLIISFHLPVELWTADDVRSVFTEDPAIAPVYDHKLFKNQDGLAVLEIFKVDMTTDPQLEPLAETIWKKFCALSFCVDALLPQSSLLC